MRNFTWAQHHGVACPRHARALAGAGGIGVMHCLRTRDDISLSLLFHWATLMVVRALPFDHPTTEYGWCCRHLPSGACSRASAHSGCGSVRGACPQWGSVRAAIVIALCG